MKYVLMFMVLSVFMFGCSSKGDEIFIIKNNGSVNGSVPGSCPHGYVVMNTTLSGVQCVHSATGAGITDGDKGDITVTMTGLNWTADNTLISGKTATAPEDLDKVIFLDTTDNKLKKANVADMGHIIQSAGITVTKAQYLNFVSPLTATYDMATNKILVQQGGMVPGGNNGDFQWNHNNVIDGYAYLSTDGATGVFLGNTYSGGLTDYTMFDTNGWQKMYGIARPWKEMKYDLTPKTDHGYTGLTTPLVDYGFAGITGNPYFKFAYQGVEFIPFTFEIPEDYEENTAMYWHLHFATIPYGENEQTDGVASFNIDFSFANRQVDCGSPESFYTYTNVLSSCSTIQDHTSDFLHYVTQYQSKDELQITSIAKKNGIIKGILYRADDSFGTYIVPLYLDINYISNELGMQNERSIK